MTHDKVDKLEEEVNLIAQGLSALDTFEKTGSRLGFQAWVDQLQTYLQQYGKGEEEKNDGQL